MFKHITLTTLLILFTGCSSINDPIPYERDAIDLQKINTWAKETNVDDIDISDINEQIKKEDSITYKGDKNKKVKRIKFPTSEYNKLMRFGKGTVKGKIYLKDDYGQPILGKGTRLYLNPITSYSKQWYKKSYLGGRKMYKADNRLYNYLRFTASNGEGEFAFYGVPNGDYYLIGTVKCKEICGYEKEKSIRIAAEVSVEGKKPVIQNLVRDLD